MICSWPLVRLETVTSKVGSGATPRGGESSYKMAGTPLIRSMNVIFYGFKREGLAYLDDEQAANLNGVEVRGGDVLLNITGASIGRVTLAPQDLDGARVNQHVCIIRPVTALDARYLRAFLSSPSMQDMIGAENYGVTRQALTKQQILDFKVPLPPLNEQRRVADKLDALLKRVDACREKLDRVPLILKRFRQAVLAAATSGALTEEWREHHGFSKWEKVPFAKLISEGPKNGLYKHTSAYGAGTRILRIDMFYDGEILAWEEMKRLDASETERIEFGLEIGDIVINRVNSPPFVGKSALVRNVPEPCVFESNMMRIRLDKRKILPEYCMRFLCSPQGLFQLRRNVKHAVNQSSINQQDVKAVIVDLPPLQEQHEIVRRVEKLFAFADRLEARYATGRKQVDQLTPSLLAKAFRGELVEQDPNDEPASVLLERIKAERAGQPISKQARGRKKLSE